MSSPALPRPAATVVLVRPGEQEISLYLVKRHGRSGFMAGAHVFPGGRVDDADATLADTLDDDARATAHAMVDGVEDPREAAAFCVAAVRETAEECGVLLARDGDGTHPDEDAAATITAELRDGRGFAEALTTRGLTPDIAELAPLAWWITPELEPKRYDTRFFLAPAPAHRADFDAHETTEGDWFTPTSALAAYARGEIALAPPTLVTLEDLAGSATLQDAVTSIERPLRAICPIITSNEDGMVLALPGDPLHGEAVPIWAERTRIVMTEAGRFASTSADAE
jgi:8-oxo-dGTP pyrophosphatase MutT (NUDIX family)